jgi:AcrR family transcriptional regulator
VTDRRIEKGKATRDRLIDAGRQAFGARGYDATSLAEILDVAGAAKGALYHHFETKAALFDAVLDRVVQETAQAAAARALGAASPAARLKAGCGAWLEMTLDPAVQRIVLLDSVAVVGWARARQIDDRHILAGLRHNLQRLAEQPGGLDADVDLLAHMVLAAVNEAALFIMCAEDPRAALAVGRNAVEALIDQLAASTRAQ